MGAYRQAFPQSHRDWRRLSLQDSKSSLCFPFLLNHDDSRFNVCLFRPTITFIISKDELRSGLPLDELLTAAPPNTAKPSKLTHSGSWSKKELNTFFIQDFLNQFDKDMLTPCCSNHTSHLIFTVANRTQTTGSYLWQLGENNRNLWKGNTDLSMFARDLWQTHKSTHTSKYCAGSGKNTDEIILSNGKDRKRNNDQSRLDCVSMCTET